MFRSYYLSIISSENISEVGYERNKLLMTTFLMNDPSKFQVIACGSRFMGMEWTRQSAQSAMSSKYLYMIFKTTVHTFLAVSAEMKFFAKHDKMKQEISEICTLPKVDIVIVFTLTSTIDHIIDQDVVCWSVDS